jgi:fatty acid desaturase
MDSPKLIGKTILGLAFSHARREEGPKKLAVTKDSHNIPLVFLIILVICWLHILVIITILIILFLGIAVTFAAADNTEKSSAP